MRTEGAWRILRILVVDDYPHAAVVLGRLLRRLGHEVETATDGRQALQSAERFHPEVIFSDIAMPKLDGYELAKKIREQPWGKHIVLIALSAFGTEKDRQEGKKAGFDDHLLKPALPAKIKSVLNSYLSRIQSTAGSG